MPDFLPPKVVGVQQRPLYIRVRTTLTILSTLWLILAVIGVGFFSGGTTSLALSLVLLYGTGAALLVVIAAIYRGVSRAARQRVETVPDDSAAAAFVDTARSATQEIMAALRPAAPAGRPAVPVRMPQSVDAIDVAAALAARTAVMTAAVAAEKTAAASADLVAPGKAPLKSPVNKSATKKKSGSKQPAQPKKAQNGKSRPANNTAARAAGGPANTAPKKSSGGRNSGSPAKGDAGAKGDAAGKGEAAGRGPAGKGEAAGKGETAARSAAGAKTVAGTENTPSLLKMEKPSAPAAPAQDAGTARPGTVSDRAAKQESPIRPPAAAPVLVTGFRTAEQDILPRAEGAPCSGLAAGPDHSQVRQSERTLATAA